MEKEMEEGEEEGSGEMGSYRRMEGRRGLEGRRGMQGRRQGNGSAEMEKGSGDLEESGESTPTPLHEQDEKHAAQNDTGDTEQGGNSMDLEPLLGPFLH